ncbi:MAG: thiamine pyrophosphate-binding protein [Bdellovibrionaceae bacterium]|nr:hypothetical protein [Bdellovibrionales bacterium]MCB9085968.1 thiamine pyrophosphate-binding protein [Pseudobdellovibrionaceae bacterium]
MAKQNSTTEEIDKRSTDLDKFKEAVLSPYLCGQGNTCVKADELAARSLIPPKTGKARDFSFVSSEIPQYISENCVACMECVALCPDAALRPRVVNQKEYDQVLNSAREDLKGHITSHFGKTKKFWEMYEKKNQEPGYFSIWVDPSKCKGCAECIDVCGDHNALRMVDKSKEQMATDRAAIQHIIEQIPTTSDKFINEKLVTDMFLREDFWVYEGGSGACRGCGEITALNMAMLATAVRSGRNMAMIAATGCNSVYSATYPYNIFDVPWTNSLFENSPAVAMGVRMRLDQQGKQDTKLWVIGGDGAMFDIGFQSLSRILASGQDINVLVLDTQTYSNTGGQASTATFVAQNAKMSRHGKVVAGKQERRKELGLLAMMHPDVYVAQVSPAYHTHFLKVAMEAVDYPGPSVIIAYSPCPVEHGIADNESYSQARAAVLSRSFPLFVHDPRKGPTMKERLSLLGNPSLKEDWHSDPKTNETLDFVWFARREGRFSKHFNKAGEPTETLLHSQQDRLSNWRTLKELAGKL